MRLKTEFMGLSLKNPILVAAGPWSRTPDRIQRSLDAGAAAVITETIAMEVRQNVRPWLYYKNGGYENTRMYSDHALEEWMQFIKKIKSDGGTVIASVMAHSPSEMAYISKSVCKAGADAIELGVSIPHGESVAVMGSNPEYLYNSIKRVVQTIDIPVMVKFSPHVTNITALAKVVEDAGAASISAIDTVRSILGVDLERQRPLLQTYGGLSGPPIKPIGLATVASIAQSVDIDVCGIGGIETYSDVLEYMMLGASAVQIGSGLLNKGVHVIDEVIQDLDQWLSRKNYKVSDVVGAALGGLKPIDDMEVLPYRAVVTGNCPLEACNMCAEGCVASAITIEAGAIKIDAKKCIGCGLCVSKCKNGCIELSWRF